MMHWTTIERDSSTNVVAPADDDSRTTDCQQDEFRCGRGPLTFERVRAAMGARMRERAGISKAHESKIIIDGNCCWGDSLWNTEKTSPLTSGQSRKIWSTGGRSGWSRA